MADKKDARQAIEDLELDKKLARVGAAASTFAQQAVARAGGFAQDHRATAHDWLDRAEGEVDRVTGGRAHDAVAKVRSGLAAGVDIVADQGPAEPEDESTSDTTPPTDGEDR